MRVLVVEDDHDQRELIRACLAVPGRETIDLVFANSVAGACAQISSDRFDCVLVDHRLPDGRGLEVIERGEENLLTTPVIGLAASLDPRRIIAYYRAGCAVFFSKQEALRADVLRRGIADAVSRFQRRAMATILERQDLRDAIVQSQERLISLARVDHVMGIANRAVFDDLHPQFHRDAHGRGLSYGLAMVDIDHFKAFNDTYGHAEGDRALRAVAEAIRDSLRDQDFVSRYGGEELVVLLDDVNGGDARSVAERLRHQVWKRHIVHAASPTADRVTVSIGVSVSSPDEQETPRRMLVRADHAMYEAKREGRNRVVLAGGRELVVV